MRTVNTDNLRNIKCEHCKYYSVGVCENRDSVNFNRERFYWHRCKNFEWHPKIVKRGDV